VALLEQDVAAGKAAVKAAEAAAAEQAGAHRQQVAQLEACVEARVRSACIRLIGIADFDAVQRNPRECCVPATMG
jgi:hypothetical protein